MSGNPYVAVEVSPGELVDKITILEIKKQRINDPQKVANVQKELELLSDTRDAAVATMSADDAFDKLKQLTGDLKSVNEALWEIEDEIRDCERNKDFGERFVELARSVYKTNDRRAALKYDINQLLDSPLYEEKSYAAY